MIAQLNRAALALSLSAGLAACDGGTGTSSTESTKRNAAPASLISLGQTGGKEGVELTVTNVATQAQVGTTEHGSKAAPGEIFIVVNFTIKNVGPGPLEYLNRPELTLLDAKGNKYAQDDSANLWARFGGEGPSVDANDLNPNVSAKDVNVWKVDKAAFDKSTWTIRLETPSQPLFALQ
jgi:hypothetical protein